MRQSLRFVMGMALLVSTCLHGQTASTTKSPASEVTPKRTTFYVEPGSVNLEAILPSPLSKEASTTTAELAELHRIEGTRTPAEVAQAKQDDAGEDIFLFQSVLGPGFNASALPSTAALSTRTRKEESTASGPLKKDFHRARPYQADSTLHPVCPITTEPNSYPSGHSLSGYLLGFILIQMVPEKSDQILKRADEYAHNRMICGVHYASDLEASRRLAYVLFGELAQSAHFQQDLSAAREETRHVLGLAAIGAQK